MSAKRILKVLFLGLVLLTSAVFQGKALAAGSAVITVEASPSKASTGQSVVLSFYVTPSGASVNSVSVNVALSKLSYVSYSASGTAFNGIAQVAPGATSTNFQVIGSYQSFGGASSKALILKVTVKASSTAGTGTVTLSGAEAYDTSENAMSASSQNRNITISKPASTSTGGGSTGGSSSGGGSTGSGTTSSGSGTTTKPKPTNTAVVPGPDTGPTVPGKTIAEPDLVAAENDADLGTSIIKKTITLEMPLWQIAAIGTGFLLLLTALIGALVYKRKNSRKYADGFIGSGFTTVKTPAINPATTPPPSKPVATPAQPDQSTSKGPTVIRPQQ